MENGTYPIQVNPHSRTSSFRNLATQSENQSLDISPGDIRPFRPLGYLPQRTLVLRVHHHLTISDNDIMSRRIDEIFFHSTTDYQVDLP